MIPGEEDLRERIRELRRQLDLTQSEVAGRAGVSQSFVAKVESGAQSPRYAAAARLYNTLVELDRQDEVTAERICSRNVVSVAPDATVGEVSGMMKEHGFSQLPVLEEGVCVGSVSSRALLGADSRDAVREWMAAAFPQVSPDTSHTAVIELLRSADAVLVHADGAIAGIITASDIL